MKLRLRFLVFIMPIVLHVWNGHLTGTWNLTWHFTYTEPTFPCITKIGRVVLCLLLSLQNLLPEIIVRANGDAQQLDTYSVFPAMASISDRIWSGLFPSTSSSTIFSSPAKKFSVHYCSWYGRNN